MFKCLFLFLLGTASLQNAYGQANLDERAALHAKLNQYAKTNADDILYLHTDKTVYTNNETLWFTAYLLKTLATQLNDHYLLSVSIIREDNRSIFLENKYLLNSGWGTGSVSLPDTIAPGNYQLIASTNLLNKNGLPVAFFSQPITVKSIREQSFNANLALLDTVVNEDGVVRAKLTVSYAYVDPKEKKQARVQYSIGKEEAKVFNLKEYEHIISIPAKRLSQQEPVLLTSITYDKEVQHLSLKLPRQKADKIQLRFFPEGGNLIDGFESRVGWEAKTSYNQPAALSGVLLKNNVPVDTIATDKNGFGIFLLSPDHNSSYSVKISSNEFLKTDTIFHLPATLEKGVLLHAPKAIVNDSLLLHISSKQAQKVLILVHNYREEFIASFYSQLKANTNKLTVVLPEIPRGIATVTILDEELRPLTERIIFARYNQKVKTEIHTDKNIYAKKEKVTVQIKLTGETGKPVKAILSAAVVQDNRIEVSKWQDIESYFFLEHDLGSLPKGTGGGRAFSDVQYLEKVLLIKGWRRYTWQNIASNMLDSATISSLPPITAQVKHNGKTLKKPVTIAIIKDSAIGLVATENDGTLPLSIDDLLIREGRKVFLLVNENDKERYQIDIHDPFKKLNEKLAEEMDIPARGSVVVQNTEDFQIKGVEKAVTLQTVVIKAKKDNSIFGTRGANACGDYVCMYNILNCPNHYNDWNSKTPVKGAQYRTPGGGFTTYAGCVGMEEKIRSVKGIYTAREFYGVDMDSLGVQQTQYLSTLAWKPLLAVDDEGEATFSFYTGDITGRFRIILQGISDDNVIAGEDFFTVK